MFWFGCWIQEIVSPTLQKRLFYVSLAVNWGVPKDIVSGIVTVQEATYLTDWNVFFYNDTKIHLFLEVGKLLPMKNVNLGM